MGEQTERKKWVKPQLVSLERFSTIEDVEARIDEIKQILHEAGSEDMSAENELLNMHKNRDQ